MGFGYTDNTANDTEFPDLVNTPQTSPISTYWRFDGPSVQSLWTEWDSGGVTGVPVNQLTPVHFAPAAPSGHSSTRRTSGPMR